MDRRGPPGVAGGSCGSPSVDSLTRTTEYGTERRAAACFLVASTAPRLPSSAPWSAVAGLGRSGAQRGDPNNAKARVCVLCSRPATQSKRLFTRPAARIYFRVPTIAFGASFLSQGGRGSEAHQRATVRSTCRLWYIHVQFVTPTGDVSQGSVHCTNESSGNKYRRELNASVRIR